tara:strand:- start:1998 stop:2201 length:204 start_codon:yes stop_codon:yes gene_type:complete
MALNLDILGSKSNSGTRKIYIDCFDPTTPSASANNEASLGGTFVLTGTPKISEQGATQTSAGGNAAF